jgi:hypothetical protein
METLDLRKLHKSLYNPPRDRPVIVDVPKFNFLKLDGRGDPNTAPEYQQAVNALFSLAYSLKFAVKKEQGLNFSVLPLEGLWWAPGAGEVSLTELLKQRADWQWTMMMAQPASVTHGLFIRTQQELAQKKNLPALGHVRLEAMHEGRCAQIMHLGPYAAELATLEILHRFIAESGHEPRGRHHEIYLSDPRRTAPEKLKTVLRQPIA